MEGSSKERTDYSRIFAEEHKKNKVEVGKEEGKKRRPVKDYKKE